MYKIVAQRTVSWTPSMDKEIEGRMRIFQFDWSTLDILSRSIRTASYVETNNFYIFVAGSDMDIIKMVFLDIYRH